MHFINKYSIASCLMFAVALLPGNAAHAQFAAGDSSSTPRDSHSHVYNVNYWVTGGIILAGGAAGLLTIPARAKPNLTDAELAAVDRNNVPSFDRWSLNQDPTLVPTYENYSTILQYTMGALPLTLLFDDDIRKDGLDVMLMGLEVNAVVIGIFTASPLGPLFETRYRPIVYYNDTTRYPNVPVALKNGNNKNSFYSGHVESAAAASFFMAKVYCDYHPDANKYIVYGAAAIPPLIMGYVRLMALDHFPSDVAVGLAVGTVCGILIPELHKIGDKNLSMGVYSSPTGAGLTMQWTPDEKSSN
jgi:membrane-associated phospholipid phosphatase